MWIMFIMILANLEGVAAYMRSLAILWPWPVIFLEAGKHGDESICCGGSLGSLTLDYADRGRIMDASIANLKANNPDCIVTACPLCYKTFKDRSDIPVLDIAELVVK